MVKYFGTVLEVGKYVNEVRWRWTEYFEQMVNVEHVREVIINVGDDRRMRMLGELN